MNIPNSKSNVKKSRIHQAVALLLACVSSFAVQSAEANSPFKWPTRKDKDKPVEVKEQKDAEPAAPAAGASDASASSGITATPTPTVSSTPLDPNRPYSPEAIKHYNRGVELHQQAFLNQAIEEYRQALAADDRLERAWSNLGTIYTSQRSYAKATEAFERALQLKPDRPTTLNGLATLLYARNKVEEAKEKWKQVLSIDPKFASAAHNIGNACEGEKKYNEAIEWYIKAVDINPKMADALHRMGSIYQKQGHSAQAELMFERALEVSPEGDFAKDARKQIGVIKSEFAKELAGQGDVKMNVVPPKDQDLPATLEDRRTASTPNTVSKAERTAVMETSDSAKNKKKGEPVDEVSDLQPRSEN